MAKLILYTRIGNYKADTISDSLLKEKIQIYEIRQVFMIGSSFYFFRYELFRGKRHYV